MDKQLNKESGFTLIELVVVIVILGILAATAVPKFMNLKDDAASAAAAGVAGALTSGYALNYAGALIGKAGSVAVAGATYDVNANASKVLGGALPAGFSVLVGGASTVSCQGAGSTYTVQVTGSSGSSSSASATMICTG